MHLNVLMVWVEGGHRIAIGCWRAAGWDPANYKLRPFSRLGRRQKRVPNGHENQGRPKHKAIPCLIPIAGRKEREKKKKPLEKSTNAVRHQAARPSPCLPPPLPTKTKTRKQPMRKDQGGGRRGQHRSWGCLGDACARLFKHSLKDADAISCGPVLSGGGLVIPQPPGLPRPLAVARYLAVAIGVTLPLFRLLPLPPSRRRRSGRCRCSPCGCVPPGRVATTETVRGAYLPSRLLPFVPSVRTHRLTRCDGRVVVVVAPMGTLSLNLQLVVRAVVVSGSEKVERCFQAEEGEKRVPVHMCLEPLADYPSPNLGTDVSPGL